MNPFAKLCAFSLSALLAVGCGDHDGHDHDGHDHDGTEHAGHDHDGDGHTDHKAGPNGGAVLDVAGADVQVEAKADTTAGEVHVWVTDAAGKPFKLHAAPTLEVDAAEPLTAMAMEGAPEGTAWKFAHQKLKKTHEHLYVDLMVSAEKAVRATWHNH